MELLEKESLDVLYEQEKKIPYYVGYIFFKENEYQGLESHQEAVMTQLGYYNRVTKCSQWAIAHYNEVGTAVTPEEFKTEFSFIEADPIMETELDPTTFGRDQYPIYVNLDMIKVLEVSPQLFFKEQSAYEQAFFDGVQIESLTRADFVSLNEDLFPEKQNLVIYSWNPEFTNYYNFDDVSSSVRLWSVYDPINKRLTVITIFLVF